MAVIPIGDLAEAIGHDLKNVLGRKDEILREARTYVKTRGVAMAVEEAQRARPRPPVDRGTYLRGFRADDVPDGVMLYNTSPYAGVIELGRRPGGKQPPIDALAAWVRRKGIARDPKDARGVAFAIARKMASQGWPFPPNQPMQILRKTALRLLPEISMIIDRVLSRPLSSAK